MNRRRSSRVFAGVVAAAALAGGCQFTGLYSLPLPGAAAQGGHIYHVTAYFSDVMDLVPESSVRVNGVTVGSVQKITLTKNYQAAVEMRIPDSVHLPANAVAVLSQTSLLGEKFIALEPPPGVPAVGTLTNGAVIENGNTSQDATVEEVFSALAALLNGGGVEQLQTISRELTQTLAGREQNVRDLLARLNTLVGNLDAHQGDIIRALDGLNRLSGELASQQQVLATALTDLGPGIQVLSEQRPELVQLLQALNRLGQIGSRVIEASQQNAVADLSALSPILTRLASAGTALPHSLELLLDYPFPKLSQRAIPSDYTGLSVVIDAQSFLTLLGSSGLPVAGAGSTGAKGSVGGNASAAPFGVGGPLGGIVSGATGGAAGAVSGLSAILQGTLE
ncbi:MAG: MCE family protein [Mycobacteriales bacterium]